ncbi:hypothetical protein GDO86_017144 [Hymenochirus boettgeri]|uniref:Nucleotidyl transferase domain-containing protein n=1 Tax=Hymenochirus boettgeri TaxID=247094 RepID=A0A8T2IPJ1_9PIPI|nr:hypothetical protein GDO86_017144 [Hymenochirus boettgeri]
MKVVILAAGYGTRLLQDIQNQDKFKHLIGIPKPLLPIGGVPLISYWVEAIEAIISVSDIAIITNNCYFNKFKEWAHKYSSITILNDGTSCNESGQIGIEKLSSNNLSLPKDTLFFEDFHLDEAIAKFETIANMDCHANLVLSYPCKDEETNKYGILETNEKQQVTAFKEKPSAKDTVSRQACPCFYVLSKFTLPLVQEFLEEKKNAQIEEKDAPGHLLSWIVNRRPVYVHPISGRFDIGNLDSYVLSNSYFLNKIKQV